jgi:hypothetical protein
MSEEKKHSLFDAYVEGFRISGEGWNGEYPYGDKGINPSEDLREYFDRWLAEKDREPQPGDGPEYHEDHAAWVRREKDRSLPD